MVKSIGFVLVVMFGTHLVLLGIALLAKKFGNIPNAPDQDIQEVVVYLASMKIGILFQ
jgi:hypothetical protein